MSAPRQPLATVLFDLDGTLLDSVHGLALAANRMRQARGLLALPPAHYRPFVSSGVQGLVQVALGAPENPVVVDLAQLRQEFLSQYEETAHLAAPFEGVAELLEGLTEQGLPWGIVTNKAARFTAPLVAASAVLSQAKVLISGDTTPHPKPHPAPLLEAARRMGVNPAACVYVGDDLRDITAGRAAGMFTVAAAYGYLGEQSDVAAWGADARADSLPGLADVIRGLISVA